MDFRDEISRLYNVPVTRDRSGELEGGTTYNLEGLGTIWISDHTDPMLTLRSLRRGAAQHHADVGGPFRRPSG